jgi:methylenetetrahydrofolate dehydrogenase (NADP+) / methenyltetrahydrofolate cyclohydrolase
MSICSGPPVFIDGKAAAAGLRARVTAAATVLKAAHGLVPGLAVVLVGEDPASQVYVRSKARATVECGFYSAEHKLPADIKLADLLVLIDALNRDPAVHGILVQLPLPGGLDQDAVIAAIDPHKDVDGLHPQNAGALWNNLPGLVPCTPLGCLLLLRQIHPGLSGLDAVVIGRSVLVGKPLAGLLLAESCTVTMAHSRTRDLPALCRRADILIAAVGRPELVRGDWIKPGATVIDVGINRVTTDDGKSRLVGDVAFAEASKVAGAITPVPGGVGPMTIACLMHNTLVAACRIAAVPEPTL